MQTSVEIEAAGAMVAISLYRGNLHRVSPDVPRRWPMPTSRISLQDFRVLIRRRAKALTRSRSTNTSNTTQEEEEAAGDNDDRHKNPNINSTNDERSSPGHLKAPDAPISTDEPKSELLERGTDQEDGGGSGPKDSSGMATGFSDNLQIEVPNKSDVGCDREKRKRDVEEKLHMLSESKHQLVQALKQILNADELKSELLDWVTNLEGGSRSKDSSGKVTGSSTDLQDEVTNNSDIASNKEKRKRDIEEKLHVLNERKHMLVQVLKQILNAEEEIKKRTSSQILSVRDIEGGESEDLSNTPGRHLLHMHSTSPSAASPLRRPAFSSLQHNMVSHTSRVGSVAPGQTQTTSNMSMGLIASPSRFAPPGHQGNPGNLPTLSVSGTHFVASSPSPAASGGTSAFRDSRLMSPSWS